MKPRPSGVYMFAALLPLMLAACGGSDQGAARPWPSGASGADPRWQTPAGMRGPGHDHQDHSLDPPAFVPAASLPAAPGVTPPVQPEPAAEPVATVPVPPPVQPPVQSPVQPPAQSPVQARVLAAIASNALVATPAATKPGLAVRPDAFPASNAVALLLAAGGHPSEPALFTDASTVFLAAQSAYAGARYADAKRLLDGLWAKYPTGAPAWNWSVSGATRRANLIVGEPTAYYALRKLSAATAWRLKRAASPAPLDPKPLVLTVLMPQRATSLQPASVDELRQGKGSLKDHELDPRLRANNYAVLRETLWLLGEYILASTDGALELRVNPIEVDTNVKLNLSLPKGSTTMNISLDYGLWHHVSQQVIDSTDWWWVLYPAASPRSEPFKFQFWTIAGGMGGDGRGAPVLICDETWVLDRYLMSHDARPNLYGGGGPLTAVERMAYHPQWLHHEIFHHVAGLYPEAKLEVESHQWFDRSKWPADFVGSFEADYFHEAMQKVFLAKGPAAFAAKLVHKK